MQSWREKDEAFKRQRRSVKFECSTWNWFETWNNNNKTKYETRKEIKRKYKNKFIQIYAKGNPIDE